MGPQVFEFAQGSKMTTFISAVDLFRETRFEFRIPRTLRINYNYMHHINNKLKRKNEDVFHWKDTSGYPDSCRSNNGTAGSNTVKGMHGLSAIFHAALSDRGRYVSPCSI
jgi:hypothetical protein